MTLTGLIPISLSQATDWAQESMANGIGIGLELGQDLDRFEAAYVIAPSAKTGHDLRNLGDNSGGINTAEADLIMTDVFDALVHAGPFTLVVEDDLALRGDQGLGQENVAFVDNRVLRWTDLRRDGANAAGLLRRGASGYPLNAYVCSLGPDLGLSALHTLTAPEIAAVAEACQMVITSVFDAETYVLLSSAAIDSALG